MNKDRTELVLAGKLSDKIAETDEIEDVVFGQGFGGITDIGSGPYGGYIYCFNWRKKNFQNSCHKSRWLIAGHKNKNYDWHINYLEYKLDYYCYSYNIRSLYKLLLCECIPIGSHITAFSS